MKIEVKVKMNSMKHRKTICALCLLAAAALPAEVFAVPASVVSEIAEVALKASGRAVSPAARLAVEKSLARAVVASGDDVADFVRRGGLQALEAGEKYGDDFWKLCRARPDAAMRLAADADSLVPLARRAGTEIAEIEAKAPGLTRELVESYGEAEARTLAAMSGEDLAKLYAFSKRFPNRCAELMREHKRVPNFLHGISATQLLGLGAGTGALIFGAGAGAAAAQVGDGVQEGLKTVAQSSPTSFVLSLWGVVAVGACAFWLLFRGGLKKLFSKKTNKK